MADQPIDTTDQQAATVAQGYAEAEAMLRDLIDGSKISDTAIRVARDHMMQFHRLASVSSASAEGRSDDEVIAEFAFLYHAYGIELDDKLAPDALELKRKVLAAVASPEPVPATNQAGEVERISKALFEADPDVGCPWEEWVAYAEAHPDHLQSVDFVRRQARAVAALATQPATSQEGEGLALRAIKAVTATAKDGAAGLSRIMAITNAAGVQTSYSDLLQDPAVALIVERPRTEWAHLFKPDAMGCAIPPDGWQCSRARGHTGPCAATPTPPTLSEDLREALEASLAKRSVAVMDPPYTAAFNAALDMVDRDTALARAQVSA